MATAVSSPASSTLKFQTNIPERVALLYADGRAVQSQFGGDQVMYSLTDGRRMYLPPHVGEKIARLGVGAHEDFYIVKRETSHGNRRVVDYHVERAEAAAPAPPPPQSSAPAPSRRGPQVVAPAQNYEAALKASIAAAAPEREPMTAAGIAAVDAVLAVEAYARSRGMTDFAFGAEDVRAVWISLSIAQRGGR